MTIKKQIQSRIEINQSQPVWIIQDFLDLGNYEAVKKALQRLVNTNKLTRINRGLYATVRINPLSNQPIKPDYQEIILAITRAHQGKILIDGMTAANALGLTNTVPGQVIIHTDLRLNNLMLDNLKINFKLTAPSKLYWAGKPAMYIVQALHWLHDCLNDIDADENKIIQTKLKRIIYNPKNNAIIDNLHEGMYTLPLWMQAWIKSLDKKSNARFSENY